MITSTDCTPTSLVVTDLHVSDHSLVTFHIPVHKPSTQSQLKMFTSRQWSKLDVSQFEHELATSELAITDSNDVDYVFQLYDNTIRTLLDKHAPPKIVRRRLRPAESPWFDAECHQAKEEVRRHERVYYSRKTSVCYRIWRNLFIYSFIVFCSHRATGYEHKK